MENKDIITKLGISIGTYGILESIVPDIPPFDTTKVKPKVKMDNKADVYVVNIYTLLRNRINAHGYQTLKDYIDSESTRKVIHKELKEEIDNLQLYITPYFYLPKKLIPAKYSTLNKPEYNYTRDKLSVPAKFMAVALANRNNIIKVLDGIEVHDTFPTGNRLVITSHIPVDLLYVNVRYLLESHTGRVINKSEFNKHYNKNKYVDQVRHRLPFNEELLAALGDKNRIIKGLSSSKDKLKILKKYTTVKE